MVKVVLTYGKIGDVVANDLCYRRYVEEDIYTANTRCLSAAYAPPLRSP